ncbi:hypothetical protein [Rhizorhabdus dicambivorans]|uniref:Uncharacterized protein n=1 Tax=Rhizorhabdus dicambivorans TaxID=1850238 RepID=A0A2A4FWE3_9SPHN|nr:hypothetical protein [Rhizorhabdus dicambivorans]ATE65994.1 hypothetical protein CMV14_17590 [Rhizorhabdus dicambivorans]PCE43111.1 hypothetical protein COO09_07375 [Rhizorhabdus dicambivorans]
MSERFIVEAAGRAVGLAVRCKGGFRFFASEPFLHRLENQVFPRFRALLRAVRAACPGAAEGGMVGSGHAAFHPGARA